MSRTSSGPATPSTSAGPSGSSGRRSAATRCSTRPARPRRRLPLHQRERQRRRVRRRGGFYLGGNFTAIGDRLRRNAAHVDANGQVTAWDPNPDGIVNAIVFSRLHGLRRRTVREHRRPGPVPDRRAEHHHRSGAARLQPGGDRRERLDADDARVEPLRRRHVHHARRYGAELHRGGRRGYRRPVSHVQPEPEQHDRDPGL